MFVWFFFSHVLWFPGLLSCWRVPQTVAAAKRAAGGCTKPVNVETYQLTRQMRKLAEATQCPTLNRGVVDMQARTYT